MSCASTGWQAGTTVHRGSPRGSKRALEIVGIVFAFFWFWPAAAAYIAWKVMGYPLPTELRRSLESGWKGLFGDNRFGSPAASWQPSFRSTGNRAFDDYRRAEIDRLEAERRRLDDEAREFRSFVEDLKRAKDREEFDAYMARRRAEQGTATA